MGSGRFTKILKTGCLGCGGLIGVSLLVFAGLAGLAVLTAPEESRERRSFEQSLPVRPSAATDSNPEGAAADARTAECAPVSLGHDARRLPEIVRARVIAEPGPETEHVVGVRGGQRVDVWKAGEEALVVGDHAVDACLLEHRFRDPDRVGVPGAPPRKVAPVLPVPLEQEPARRLHSTTGRRRSTRIDRAVTRAPSAKISTPPRAALRRARV